MEDKNLICVGAITGAFGVRGEVRLKSFCADPAAISDYSPLSTENGAIYDVELTRNVKSGFAAKITGVTNKEDADALRGTRLYSERTNLPSLPDDEYYHSDLIGLSVLDTGGENWGNVSAVHDHGAGDIVEINLAQGGDVVLLPFTRANVPTVDLDKGCIIVDPPEGVFPDSGK